MDEQLAKIIAMLHHQNDELGKARFKYLDMEAERKHFEGNLIMHSHKYGGLTTSSHAQKTSYAQASTEWLEFHKKLARLESEYEFQKLKFQVLEKEFLAIHLTLKLDAETIRKG